MIEKKGYVFVPKETPYRPLFGISAEDPRGYANIETNDFDFFQTEKEMTQARKKFSLIHTLPCHLEMKIAQSKEEVDKFTQGNLVVIYDMSDFSGDKLRFLQKRIFGPKVKGKQDEFNGICARIGHTNFKTFYYLGNCYAPGTAKYAAKEAHRQGDWAPVTIAKFKLEFLT